MDINWTYAESDVVLNPPPAPPWKGGENETSLPSGEGLGVGFFALERKSSIKTE
jgi:hypothetical protein